MAGLMNIVPAQRYIIKQGMLTTKRMIYAKEDEAVEALLLGTWEAGLVDGKHAQLCRYNNAIYFYEPGTKKVMLFSTLSSFGYQKMIKTNQYGVMGPATV